MDAGGGGNGRKDNWTAYANLGTVLDPVDSDRALVCFEKSVSINPDFGKAQRSLGGM